MKMYLKVIVVSLLLMCGFYGCHPNKCRGFTRNPYCPGELILVLFRGNFNTPFGLYYDRPIKVLNNKSMPPDSNVTFSSSYSGTGIQFSLRPGCREQFADLDQQVFRDTLYLWIPSGSGYDIDTLHFEYKFFKAEGCPFNRYIYANLRYNGELFEAEEELIIRAVKRR